MHTIQLFGDAVKDRSEQTSRDVLSRMVRIIKCRYLAVIAPVNLDALINVFFSDAVATQGYFYGRAYESAKLAFIGHRMTKLFESLYNRGDDAWM